MQKIRIFESATLTLPRTVVTECCLFLISAVCSGDDILNIYESL